LNGCLGIERKDVKRDETLWGKTKHFEIHRSPEGKPLKFENNEIALGLRQGLCYASVLLLFVLFNQLLSELKHLSN